MSHETEQPFHHDDEPLPQDLLDYRDKLRHHALISEAMQHRRVPVDALPWRISSAAGDAGFATAIAALTNPDTNARAWFLTKVAVRDGKPVITPDEPASVSAFSEEEWNAFTEAIRGNEFEDDRLPNQTVRRMPSATRLNIDAERCIYMPHEQDDPSPETPRAIGSISLFRAQDAGA